MTKEELIEQISKIEKECIIYRNDDFYSFDHIEFTNKVLELLYKQEEYEK